MKTVKAIASGKVQGVGFRVHTQQKAQQFGIKGYVRNLNNGDVEIIATGEVAAVNELLKWAKSGSPSAVVNNLEVDAIKNTEEFAKFEIRR